MKLEFSNLSILNKYYKLCSDFEPISPYTYLMWTYFDYEIYFYERSGYCIIIGKNIDNNTWYGMSPYSTKKNFLKAVMETKEILKEHSDTTIRIALMPEDKMTFLPQEKFSEYQVTNYISVTTDLIAYPGKELQKKRNNFNYFVKNYEQSTKIVNLTSENILQEYNNAEEMILSITDSNREKEFLDSIIKNFNKCNFSGSSLYLDNKCIGFTIGLGHQPYYEIFVEKCSREIRGAYQYILSKNLSANATKYIYTDRQDDSNIENIRISKLSYRPSWVISRVCAEWEK